MLEYVLIPCVLFFFPPTVLLFSFYVFECLPQNVCMCIICLPGGLRTPGTGVTDGSETPCWSWELNDGPLKGQKVFLNTESPF